MAEAETPRAHASQHRHNRNQNQVRISWSRVRLPEFQAPSTRRSWRLNLPCLRATASNICTAKAFAFASARASLDLSVPGPKEVERVLISEVLVQSKEGEQLDSPELQSLAVGALKACKPNSVLKLHEVQEDVRRVIESGYFSFCMPVAIDTRDGRDGIRLIFLVEPNQEFRGLVCDGANVLPTRILENAFRGEYGKVVNIQRLDNVLTSINNWYGERGLFAQVSDVEMLSGGIIRLLVSEAGVNNIAIRFLDRKTENRSTNASSTTYYQKRADTGKVDLTKNVVERVSGGFSAGGGISGKVLPTPVLSVAVIQCITIQRGQLGSSFRVNYTDPWIEGDDKRTLRSITVQNSLTPGTQIYGPNQSDPSSVDPSNVTIGRLMGSVDYSRPLRPKWSGTAGLSFQRAGPLERNLQGQIRISDIYAAPLTFSGKAHDDMLLAKLETVYADSWDRGSSMLVFNMEQGLPILPDWLFFNRLNVRARHGKRIGPAHCIASFSGGKVIGDLAPHEAFAIGGTNSVRGYEEGAVGSGRSCLVASAEMSVPLFGPLEGAIFGDYGTDLGSGQTVPGDPAGARNKPGSGYGYGVGVRVDSPLGPLRLEYAQNNLGMRRFHFGVGYRN